MFRRAAAARRAASASAPVRSRRAARAAARERGTTAADVEAGLYADRPARQRLLAFAGRPPAALAAGFALARRRRCCCARRSVTASRPRARRRDVPAAVPHAQVPAPAARRQPRRPAAATASSSTARSACSRAAPATASSSGWRCRRSPRATAGRSRPTSRWGADRRPLRFRARRRRAADAAAMRPRRCPTSSPRSSTAFERWTATGASTSEPAVLDLPGAGMCVPDLAFVRAARRRARPLRAARLLEPGGGLAPRRAGARRPAPPDPVRGQQGPARRRGRPRRRRRPPRSTSSPASSPPSRCSTASSASPTPVSANRTSRSAPQARCATIVFSGSRTVALRATAARLHWPRMPTRTLVLLPGMDGSDKLFAPLRDGGAIRRRHDRHRLSARGRATATAICCPPCARASRPTARSTSSAGRSPARSSCWPPPSGHPASAA